MPLTAMPHEMHTGSSKNPLDDVLDRLCALEDQVLRLEQCCFTGCIRHRESETTVCTDAEIQTDMALTPSDYMAVAGSPSNTAVAGLSGLAIEHLAKLEACMAHVSIP